GGQGILLGGVPGVKPATVVIIGGGTAGIHAARMACGLGARVYILDTNQERIRYLTDVMPGNCLILMSDPQILRELLVEADLVIGAVLIPGAKAPTLITRKLLKTMKPKSVIVDIAIDQGGCFATSKATTHKDPVYTVDGIIHYCVTNMPGAVPKTSTLALTNATISYAIEIADKGWKNAARDNPEIRAGLNVVEGNVTCKGVADAFRLKYVPPENTL
ncbi:MAG: NAD(P)-dependent oxidoreductase, partial [Desulfobacterales bacterium]